MRDLLKRAKPDRLEDLIALNALYRPGPMDLIPDYVERKHGRQRVEYLDPRLEEILGETYGVMVYQEQVMRIAQVIGGYSLGGADLLRRAMGKKKPEEMAKHRTIFVEGAGKNGVPAHIGTRALRPDGEVRGLRLQQESHSAAYAVVACQTAYLKKHHTAAFCRGQPERGDRRHRQVARNLVEDGKPTGVQLLPPEINAGELPLRAGRPRGRSATAWAASREPGGRRSSISSPRAWQAGRSPISSTSARGSTSTLVNRRVIEALVRAGAFDELDPIAPSCSPAWAVRWTMAEHSAAHANQASLFGGGSDERRAPREYIAVAPWTTREQLANEKLALGYYFCGHLFTEVAAEARRFAPRTLAEVRAMRTTTLRGEVVRCAGIIVSARTQNTRRGRMGVVTLDDGTEQLETHGVLRALRPASARCSRKTRCCSSAPSSVSTRPANACR